MENVIDKEITDFLKSNIVATVCCGDKDSLWCFNCFYTFIEESCLFVFKSSVETRHGEMLQKNDKIAGTILPAIINFAGLQGIQFEGKVLNCEQHFIDEVTELYHKVFPIGANVPGIISIVKISLLKLTDNTKGFGYKNTWKK